MKKIAIIGGGASGLFCAIRLLTEQSNANVTIFEKMSRVGKKILATGNGRCNITNQNADKPEHYHSDNVDFVLPSLNNFSNKDLIKYFEDNAIILRKEDDKYYPFSEQAGTILDFLRLKAEFLGAKIVCDTKIEKIEKSNKNYTINNEKFDYVVVACGGKSSPHLGSDGSGYKLLQNLSHTLTPLYPAITQIKTNTEFVKQLKGIKADALCKIYVDGDIIREEFGQVLFADYGLSGPPIFQLSLIAAKNYQNDCKISLDFMNDMSEDKICDLIHSTISNPYTYPLTLENLLSTFLNKRLGQVILKYCGFKLNLDAYELTQQDIQSIAKTIKKFELKVNGVNGFQNAQVTAGGINVNEFNPKTLESKYNKNLYAIGEILDVTGDCGGYNLQWAFSSGSLCARSISEDIND